MSRAQSLTVAEELALPVTVDVPTAGRAFGLGRDAAYRLARTGEFPVPVLRFGTRLVVTRAALLSALGISDSPQQAPSDGQSVADQSPCSTVAPDSSSDAPRLRLAQ